MSYVGMKDVVLYFSFISFIIHFLLLSLRSILKKEKTLRYIIITLLLILLGSNTLQAQSETTDSVKVSLLTCSPGTEIYSLFGHTAIRYENPAQGIDVAFNYGMFSFNTPNFIYRFVKGETDYQLGVTDFPYFEAEYAMRNSSVTQQTLNLTDVEKERLWEILKENYRPENRVYRYNFFYDNCTTRARDRVEDAIDGTVKYNENNSEQSFRDIVHQYTKGHDWSEFGIDLLIGSDADKPIDYRKKMFAPFYLLNALEGAKIINKNGEERDLVFQTEDVVTRVDEELEKEFPVSPMGMAFALFIATLALTIYGVRKNKILWGLDILLFGAAGLAGCVIAFLVFFSVHPAVSPNYLLFFLNPIHLFFLPFMTYLSIKRRKDPYHLINFAVLTLFIVLWPVIPQRFNLAVLPLAACLLIRSASNIILTYKRN